jgi:hypothetical protein
MIEWGKWHWMSLCIWLGFHSFYTYMFSRLRLLHGVTMDIGVQDI